MNIMKITTSNKIATLILASLISCFAMIYAQESPDTYEEANISKKSSSSLSKSLAEATTSLLHGDKPIGIGEGSLFEYNTFGTDIKQSAVRYHYYPKAKAVVVEIVSLVAKSYIYLDASSREAFRNAYKQYFSDFEKHLLSKTSRKTYNVYGSTITEYRQGMIGTATITKPKTTLGYRFFKNSPYFCITLWPAEAEPFAPGVDVEPGDGSPRMTFFMTKKQFTALVNALDEDKIEAIIQEEILSVPKNEYADEY